MERLNEKRTAGKNRSQNFRENDVVTDGRKQG